MPPDFLAALARGHAEAVQKQDRLGMARIEAWHQAKLAQAAGGRLSARIGRRDVLALPPGR